MRKAIPGSGRPRQHPDSAGKLAELAELFKTIETETTRIVDKASELVKVQSAARYRGQGRCLAGSGQQTARSLCRRQPPGTPVRHPAQLSDRLHPGVIALVLLIVLFYIQNNASRGRLIEAELRKQETEEQNRRNQDAILRLLDELGNLAEGDLTVQASVTEDITGPSPIRSTTPSKLCATWCPRSTVPRDWLPPPCRKPAPSPIDWPSPAKSRLGKSRTPAPPVMQMAQSMDEVSSKTAAFRRSGREIGGHRPRGR